MQSFQVVSFRSAVFVALFSNIIAFMPNNYVTTETDYTHKLITERAMFITAAKYIKTFLQPQPSGNENRSNFINAERTVEGFFGHDRHSLELFTGVVQRIVYGNNNAQEQFGNDAKYTMNAEQIMEGNIFLQNKRDSIITMSKSAKPNWDFIRLTVGEYLMTLQMFYSNTNWVEIKGQKVNTALGIPGKTMIPVAPVDMATCINCNFTVQAVQSGVCDNNLINNGYLTSGYKSGQHLFKPQGLWLGGAGKCSHGGSWDSTQKITASGGINKETSNPSKSPHFYLHNQAGEAAIEATIYFLIGSDNGLLDMIGEVLFGDLLSLHLPCFNCLSKQHSITFVIDDTGSMRSIINGVIRSCIDILNQAEDAGGAAFYALVTFNDPVPVHVNKTTTSINLMKNWLQGLRVDGGNDCPELAMQGLLQVGRKKRYSGSWGSFSSLISSTSSSAVKVPAGAIAKTIGDTIDVNTGISFTYIANISMISGHTFRFPVDNQIMYFTVELTKENSKRNINLFRPNGSVVMFSIISETFDVVGDTTILSIKKPVVGMWKLQNKGSNKWRVIVKGKGDIRFDSQLLEEKGGIPFPLSGSSPVAGSNITVGVTVKDIDDNSSLDKIILRSDSNDIVHEFDLRTTNRSVVHAKLAVPSQAFRITIEGKDNDSNVFRRTSKDMITPVTANIIISPVKDDLIEGIPKTIHVIVSNDESSDDTFNVVAFDTQNFLQSQKQVLVSVPAHNSTLVEFRIVATRKSSVTMLTVELKKSNRTIQSKSTYLMVQKSIPPIINTTSQTPACSKDLMNNVNCTFGTWFMETSLNCNQPCTDLYVASSVASLAHDTLNRTGIISANISGDCCSAEGKLVAVDSLLNIAELSIDFTGGHEFEVVKTKSELPTNPPNITVIEKSKACESEYINRENCTYGNWWAKINIKFEAVARAIYLSPNKSNIGNGSIAKIEHDDLKSMRKIIHANVSGTCCLNNVSLFAKDDKGQLTMRQLDFSGGIKFPIEKKSKSLPIWATIVIACVAVGILVAVGTILYKKNHKMSVKDQYELNTTKM